MPWPVAPVHAQEPGSQREEVGIAGPEEAPIGIEREQSDGRPGAISDVGLVVVLW